MKVLRGQILEVTVQLEDSKVTLRNASEGIKVRFPPKIYIFYHKKYD